MTSGVDKRHPSPVETPIVPASGKITPVKQATGSDAQVQTIKKAVPSKGATPLLSREVISLNSVSTDPTRSSVFHRTVTKATAVVRTVVTRVKPSVSSEINDEFFREMEEILSHAPHELTNQD